MILKTCGTNCEMFISDLAIGSFLFQPAGGREESIVFFLNRERNDECLLPQLHLVFPPLWWIPSCDLLQEKEKQNDFPFRYKYTMCATAFWLKRPPALLYGPFTLVATKKSFENRQNGSKGNPLIMWGNVNQLLLFSGRGRCLDQLSFRRPMAVCERWPVSATTSVNLRHL